MGVFGAIPMGLMAEKSGNEQGLGVLRSAAYIGYQDMTEQVKEENERIKGYARASKARKARLYTLEEMGF